MAKAKPARGSFNTRGRQKVAAQQAGRRAATPPTTNALPPRGGTGAGRPRAVAQRTAAAVSQRAQQDVNQLRGLGRYLQHQSNQADKQIAPRTSPVITPPNTLATTGRPSAVGPRRQLPPSSRGGALTTSARGTSAAAPSGSGGRGGRPALPPGTRGGAASTRGGSGAATRGNGVTRVSVRDVTGEGRGSARPALPPGRPGGALARSARGAGGRLLNAAGSAFNGALTYSDAVRRGETQGRSLAQGFSAAAGTAAGARIGASLPLPPALRPLAAAGGAVLGGDLATRATQGIQEAGKAADARRNPPKQGPNLTPAAISRIKAEQAARRDRPARPPMAPPDRRRDNPPAVAPSRSAPAPAARRGSGGGVPASPPRNQGAARPQAAAPASTAPAAQSPTKAEPNLYNTPRSGVPKFRTDMNPLGKKIVGTTNFSRSVPSERPFDTTSDYGSKSDNQSSLAIPSQPSRPSSGRGPTGRDEMLADNNKRAKRKK